MEIIEKLATGFREAIDDLDRALLPFEMKNFPHGCCGDASMLLGAYLEDHGIKSLIYVCGMRSGRSHAWLESDSLIIDITADQFEECNESVIVAKDSEWHRTFDRDLESEASFKRYDKGTVNRLSWAYEEILKHIQL